MKKRLDGKIAVVTGGGSGIGFAIAQRFAGEGATVIITGRRKEVLDEAVAKIGNGISAIVADASKLNEIEALYAEVERKHGRLDVLVANAGGGTFTPLGKITEEDIDRMFGSNVKGVIFAVQQALPLLSNNSSVVVVGSTASIQPGASLGIYGATKAAIRNLIRSWILDLKGSGIRMNVLSPGPVNTQSLRDMMGSEAKTALAFLSERSPLGRIGESEEIASVALFLASDESSYVNGIELFADGGASQV